MNKERLTYTSYNDIAAAGAPVLSPDGKKCAYYVSRPGVADDRDISSLYIADTVTGEFFCYEQDTALRGARFLDNDMLSVCKAEDGKTVVYALMPDKKELVRLFEVELKGASAEKLWDGKWLIRATVDRNGPFDGKQELYDTFDEYPFLGNTRGNVSKLRNTLFIYDEATAELKQFTADLFHTADYMSRSMEICIDREGRRIVYWGQEYDLIARPVCGLYCYYPDTGINLTLMNERPLLLNAACVLNEKVWFIGQSPLPGLDFIYNKIYSIDIRGGEPVLELDPESAPHSIFAAEGAVWFEAADRNGTGLFKLTDNGPEYIGPYTRVCKSGGTTVGIYGEPVRQPEICVIPGHMPLSDCGKEFNEKYHISPVYHMSFMCDAAMPVDGWVIPPVDYEPGKKYPGILLIHGGPQGRYDGTKFIADAQIYSAEGYFAFFCNPRGSNGQGREFQYVSGKYGTIDFDDLMQFTDKVLELYPDIDSTRLGVTGGSYGGFMTNWVIGHTDRFAAAVSVVSISNYFTKPVGDIGWYDMTEQRADAWHNAGELWWHSPLKYAKNVKTPTMFCQNDEDFRCPIDQAEQMYSALVHLGVETRMIVYKGASHGGMKPSQKVHRMKETLAWFGKYLRK